MSKAIIKAINRRFRRHANAFTGGQVYGVDYATFCAVYPHIAHIYNAAAREFTGRPGRFIPPVFR